MSETPATYDDGEDPARRASIERLVAAFDDLMHRLSSAHAREFLEVGLTMSQAKVLYLVHAEPRIRMAALSGRLGVSLSTISGVVDRLVDQGMLTRRDDPADRRQVVIGITPTGAEHVERLRELNARQLRSLLTRIDTADLAVVERALVILVAATAPQPGGPVGAVPLEGAPA